LQQEQTINNGGLKVAIISYGTVSVCAELVHRCAVPA